MKKKPISLIALRLLGLQIVYAVVASLFNLASLRQITLGQPGLTNTSPVAGLIMMVIILIAAVAGLKGYDKVLLAINLLLITPLLYSGIFEHLRVIFSSDVGVLQAPLGIAVAINSFGAIVMTLVVILFIKLEPSKRQLK
ncbi:MAG: hypothetical protein JKX81_18095 [Arenicella sp.]|nr:hypothetical protein [Arenicella sp.]